MKEELGPNLCENPWQGSFIVDKLTDIVEEAVYKEFEAIGALSAMGTTGGRRHVLRKDGHFDVATRSS